MSSFDERGNIHDRAGRFSEKKHSAPTGTLTPAHDAVPNPLSVRLADGKGGYTAVVDAPTGRVYMKDGVLNRTDGPAYEGEDGTKEWRIDGVLSRDGNHPAVIHDDGSTEHWENGHPISL